MDSTFGPTYKRQLMLLGAVLGAGLVATFFLGFIIGMAVNVGLLIAVSFYIRSRRNKALKSLGFSSESAGGGFMSGANPKLKYVCLSCGAEMTGSRCRACGSHMKKPLF